MTVRIDTDVDNDRLAKALNEIVAAIQAIADKLDADSGVNDTDYGSTITDDMEDDYRAF